MNKQELRTLRGQVMLLAGLFAASIVLAGAIAFQRGFFERFLREKYAVLPESLRPLADAAGDGTLDSEQFVGLSEQQRLALYEDWMVSQEPRSAETPRTLVAADPLLYIARAERTLVCGKAEQKAQALEFLRLAGSRQAVPMLRKAQGWARRRNWPTFAGQIEATIIHLEQIGLPEVFPATFPTTAEATEEVSNE